MKRFIAAAKWIRQANYSPRKYHRRMFLMNRLFGTQFRARKYEHYQGELFIEYETI